ncbi:MAG: hypothetical protein JSW33_04705 [bacterium]|nr:MAG: hypothetical protein JSW33_04705 [bacterium]
MYHSFKAFMNGLIDYAGLFPPARLSLEEAFDRFLAYQEHPSGWILSHFICPARLLPKLITYRKILQEKEIKPFLTVLPDSDKTPGVYLRAFEKNIQKLDEFLQRMDQWVNIGAFEFRIPSEFLADKTFPPLHEFFLAIHEKIKQVGIQHPKLFFELHKSGKWLKYVDLFAKEIERFNELILDNEFSELSGIAGLKLRCGGESPEIFPSGDEISVVLSACSARRIPFKATAGLHHPIRQFNLSVQHMMHGFLNVFCAAMLTFHHRLSKDQILTILNEENPGKFLFTDDHFRYGDWILTTPDIQQLRAKYIKSFGSCSFEEPREDLITLGLLEE